MTIKEYREICSKEGYLENKSRFYKTYSLACIVLASLASLFWSFKDIFGHGLQSVPVAICIVLVMRSFPILVAPFAIRSIKRDSQKVSVMLNILAWCAILGAFVGIWYLENLNKLTNYHPVGDGWLAYYVILYVFSLLSDNFWMMPLDVIIMSFLIWFTDKMGWVPCGIGSIHVISTGVMFSVPLYVSSIFFKKAFAEYFTVFNHLENIAKTDALTGCYNRFVIKDFTENNKLKKDCTIFIIDVDNFKHINDKFGHDLGDSALIETVKSLGRSCRDKGDKVIRYGGDEFVVYLEEVINPTSFYERFCYHKKHQENLRNYNITHSVGAAVGLKGENVYDVIAKADAALYDIKNSTKNGFKISEK